MKCKNCQKEFTILLEHREIYKKIDVPDPTWCPECRFLRRLIFRNEKTLYSRQCSLCSKDIISTYPADTDFSVYCPTCFYSDKWDPRECGREFDFSRPFFDQFFDLRKVVPRVALMQMNTVNSDYSNMCGYGKNYYLAASTIYSEDIYYSKNIDNSTMCVDCLDCSQSEIMYMCFLCNKGYSLFYCFDCKDCNDCKFCFDCHGCASCFGCYGLRNKSYCFFNQQLTKEEYSAEVAKTSLSSYKKLEEVKNRFIDVVKNKAVHRFSHIFNCSESNGDYLNYCVNVKNSFFVNESTDCFFIDRVPKQAKDCMDIYAGGEGEFQYEGCGGVKGYNCLFNYLATDGKYLRYTDFCMSGSYLFGCISAHHQKYCILNKQYTEEEYNKLVQKIVEYMRKTGEWGEYFPPEKSLFGYNETIAMEFNPITRDEALARGWRWQDNLPGTFGRETIKNLPDDIKGISDSITKEILVCVSCAKNYRIIPQELDFYRKYDLALPRKCPNCRLVDRLYFRNGHKLYHRQCMCENTEHGHEGRCKVEFETTYASDRPERVYCEECYRKEIY